MLTPMTNHRNKYNDRFRVEFLEVRNSGSLYGVQGPTAPSLVSAVKTVARDGRRAQVIDRHTGNLVLAFRDGVWTGRNGTVVTTVNNREIADLLAEVAS